MKALLILILCLYSNKMFSQNTTCIGMTEICPIGGQTFILNSNGPVAPPGNNYGCLLMQANPSWFFFQISTSGDIFFSLSAPSDIDFIIYGPFSSSQDAINNCGQLGDGNLGGNIIDCSYSSTNQETPEIGFNSSGGATTAQAGEVYVLLVTNYANSTQIATLTQTSGTGAINCMPTQCFSNVGTFVKTKNGIPTTTGISLVNGESFSLLSNQDYVLPTDTVSQPLGDGVYSAQLMWLVYNNQPIMTNGNIINPITDPGFLGVNNIISTSNVTITNTSTDPFIQTFGYGTFYFVPTVGDDGVGGNNNVANGVNDNGGLFWDSDGNGCFSFGNPYEITILNDSICLLDSASISAIINNASCNVCTDGAIDITVTDAQGQGFNSLLNYNWSNGQTTEDINSLTPSNYTVTISSLLNGCSIDTTFQVGSFSALNSNPNNYFNVYPNPTNQSIFIFYNYSGINQLNVEIFDTDGTLCFLKNITTPKGNLEVDLSHFANGVYFVRIKSNKETKTIKLVKTL